MARKRQKKLPRDNYVTAICPDCGRFMNKVTGWVCRKCGDNLSSNNSKIEVGIVRAKLMKEERRRLDEEFIKSQKKVKRIKKQMLGLGHGHYV